MTPSVPTDADPAADRGRALVLVAAADPQVLAAVAAIIRHAGFRVVEAGDGESAAAACRSDPGEFAAALMDVQMPKLDGAGAIRAIRQAAPSVRCFLMTGGYYGREQLAQAGADRVFGKPLDVPALLRALADAVACGADEEPRSDRAADREVRADGGA